MGCRHWDSVYKDHSAYIDHGVAGGYLVHHVPLVYTANMGASRAFISPDFRGRFALGKYTRDHDTFLLSVSAEGIITLTPADLVPLPAPAPVRRRNTRPRKKAAPAAADKSQKEE